MARRTRVIGADRVKALLNRMSEDLKKEIDAATKEEADALAAAIRRAVPVDSGALKASVRVVKHPWKIAAYAVKIGGVPGTRKKVRKGVTDADFAQARASGGNMGEFDYALAVEFGHVGEEGKRVPAQPYAWPTYRARLKAMRARLRTRARKVFNTRASKG